MKVAIFGSSQTGKTTLLRRICGRGFLNEYEPTIGCEVVDIDNNKYWDIAGNRKYQGIMESYYKGTDYAIIVFSITRPRSIKEVEVYINKIKAVEPDVKIIVVCNKMDRDRKISIEAMNEMKKKLNPEDKYFEISTKFRDGDYYRFINHLSTIN